MLWFFLVPFLVACTQLYDPLCRSVRQSVHRSVTLHFFWRFWHFWHHHSYPNAWLIFFIGSRVYGLIFNILNISLYHDNSIFFFDYCPALLLCYIKSAPLNIDAVTISPFFHLRPVQIPHSTSTPYNVTYVMRNLFDKKIPHYTIIFLLHNRRGFVFINPTVCRSVHLSILHIGDVQNYNAAVEGGLCPCPPFRNLSLQ